jgi:hypothetical protein
MADAKLSIELALVDKVTAGFSKAMGQMQKDIKKVTDDMVSLGRQISVTGRNMTFLGAAITGPMAIAFKTASNYSVEANQSLQRLTNSAVEFQTIIGNAMIPVIDKVSASIARLTDWFKSLDPKVRDMVVQGVLLVGIFLTLGGAILNLIGKITSLIGRMAAFAQANAPLLIMAAIIVAIIHYWDQARIIILPIITALEVAVLMLAIGYEKVALAMTHVLAFGAAMAGKQDLAVWFEEQAIGIEQSINRMENALANALSGQGAAQAVDQGIQGLKVKIAEFWDALTGPTATANFSTWVNQAKNAFTQFSAEVDKVGQHMANIMITSIQMITSGFGKAVADMIVYGKNFGESMKQVFQSWAAMAIQKIIEVITQWIIMHTIGKALEMIMITFVAGTASTIASLWAVPAALASLATMGGNAGPASAALMGVTALSAGLAAVPMLAEGGIVTRPTLAMVGERGPEAVIPLGRGNAGSNISVVMNNVSFRSEDDIEDVMTRLSNLIVARTRSRV